MDENCDFVKRKHLVLSGTLKKTNAKYFMRISVAFKSHSPQIMSVVPKTRFSETKYFMRMDLI